MSGAKQTERVEALRRFKPYPAYKDSGVEWLGEIPVGWEVRPLKRIGNMRAGAAITSQDIEPDGVHPVFGGNGIRGYTESHTHDGDFPLIGRQGALCGCVNFASGKFWASEHAVVVTPGTGVDAHWLADLLTAMSLNQYSQSAAQPGVAIETIGAIPAPAPSSGEQCAITTFLDRQTERIDALVAKKERLIELLQERRTSLINRAVTKGLDPNVPMKDSGVEWLGKIPEHWVIAPLKSLLRRCDYGISDSLTEVGDIRVLTMAHIQNGAVVLPGEGVLKQVDDELMLECGDLLFNRTNSRELVAKVGMFRGSRDDRVTFASYLVRMTARDGVVADWLNYLLNSAGVLGLARSMALLSVNQANLNPTKYTQIVLPLLPEAEQRAIAAFLDHETAHIDALTTRIHQAITHLKELRTALISAAVTGKIDVREEVA